jgi:hypothetical protein
LINQLLLICSTIIIYEFVKFINFVNIVINNFKLFKKILRLFSLKKISDSKKEKLIFIYSKLLFIVSIKIFAILFSIMILIIILSLLSNSYLNLATSFFGITEMTIIFIVYHLIRKKIYAKLQ